MIEDILAAISTFSHSNKKAFLSTVQLHKCMAFSLINSETGANLMLSRLFYL